MTARGGEAEAERQAFLRAFWEQRAALRRYCRMLAGNRDDADDLLQETWARAWAARRSYHPGQPGAYLRRIAYRLWIDGRRRKDARPAEAQPALEAAARSLCRRADGERAVAELEAALEYWTPRQCLAVLLKDGLRFTVPEIAVLTGATPGAVKALLHRARAAADAAGERAAEKHEGTAGAKAARMRRRLAEDIAGRYAAGEVEALIRLLQPAQSRFSHAPGSGGARLLLAA